MINYLLTSKHRTSIS